MKLLKVTSVAGPRIITAFVYLSELPKGGGGGTVFPRASRTGRERGRQGPRKPLRVQPRKGKLILWSNVQDAEPWKNEAGMFLTCACADPGARA